MYDYLRKYCFSSLKDFFSFQTKVELSAFVFCRGNIENEVKLIKSPATPQELDSLSWMAAKSISHSAFWHFHGVQNRWRKGPSRNKTLERRCKWTSSYSAVDGSVEKRSTFKGTKWQQAKMRYQLSAIDGWHSTKTLPEQIALHRKRKPKSMTRQLMKRPHPQLFIYLFTVMTFQKYFF